MGRDTADFSRYTPERIVTIPVTLSTESGDATDIVVGLVERNGVATLVGTTPVLETTFGAGRPLVDVLVAGGATHTEGTVRIIGFGDRRIAVVGLGEDLDLTAEQLRRAAGSAVRTLLGITLPQPRTLAISLDTGTGAQVAAGAQGAVLAADSFTKISGTAPEPIQDSVVVVGPASAAEAMDRALAIAEAVQVVRDWVNLPPNLLGPGELAGQAKDFLALADGIEVEILEEKALAKQGYNGILAVGGGSVRPPRLIRAEYAPKQATRHLVLVGKGVTYDSGGYNLKTEASLLTMKQDMAGAATVLAATKVIAQLGLPLHVTAYAPVVESMISGSAYRPGDVITTYDGTTVENSNSDCEGRIILADALARAHEDSPDLIVDVATLTGACIVALGERVAGLMTSDDQVADEILDAAQVAGEDYWQLPITDEVRAALPSPFADLRSKSSRHGATLYAAAFLQHFVKDSRWAHLDIAGPAWNSSKAYSYVPENATGASLRTLVALAEQMAQ